MRGRSDRVRIEGSALCGGRAELNESSSRLRGGTRVFEEQASALLQGEAEGAVDDGAPEGESGKAKTADPRALSGDSLQLFLTSIGNLILATPLR